MKKFGDISGSRFGKVLAVSKRSRNQWDCICDCGCRFVGKINELVLLTIQCPSCDSSPHEGLSIRQVYLSEYRIWVAMWHRCTSPINPAYKHYGGRGIKVDQRWWDFSEFIKDMGPRPSSDYSIEREDVNGNYEPENCIWIPRRDQQRNKRSCVFFTFNGVTKCASEWAEQFGIMPHVMRYRIRKGWNAPEIFS